MKRKEKFQKVVWLILAITVIFTMVLWTVGSF